MDSCSLEIDVRNAWNGISIRSFHSSKTSQIDDTLWALNDNKRHVYHVGYATVVLMDIEGQTQLTIYYLIMDIEINCRIRK